MRNCLVIDLDRCSGCDTCIVACKYAHGLDLGVCWNRVQTVTVGTFPNVEQYWLPRQCQQCENAPCLEVCPTGATYREDEYGLVVIDADACIGCKLCMDACPYNARRYDEGKGIVEKCDCCIARLKDGEKPACVHNCCAGGRFFGDLDDPESDAAKAVAEAGEENCHWLADASGAEPRTVYILHEKTAAWQDKLQDFQL